MIPSPRFLLISIAAAMPCWTASLAADVGTPAVPTIESDKVAFAQFAAEVIARAGWQPIWDGKTTRGWHETGKGQWTIKEGAIIGRHSRTEREFGHLVTDVPYKDFAIRLKYKAIQGNSGLYFRIEEKGGSGVSGFQAEIDPNRDAGGLYETNGRAWVVRPSPQQVATWYKPKEWNEMSVLAVGRNVAVHVNGKSSAVLLNDRGRTEGRIALQLHGGQDLQVMFKDIEIAVFDDLLPGPGLAGWHEPIGQWQMVGEVMKDPANEKLLASKPGTGAIVNGANGRTNNFLTKMQHGDVALHVEFMVPKGSNSGVYFQGRYEIQVLDSWGATQLKHGDCGGIYERWDPKRGAGRQGFEGHAPRVNASLPPGEWQSFDAIFLAPRFDAAGKKTASAKFVKVFHNGRLVHEDVEVTGPTRAAAFEDEKPTGPLMLQGDHGPVTYRNLRIVPLVK